VLLGSAAKNVAVQDVGLVPVVCGTPVEFDGKVPCRFAAWFPPTGPDWVSAAPIWGNSTGNERAVTEVGGDPRNRRASPGGTLSACGCSSLPTGRYGPSDQLTPPGVPLSFPVVTCTSIAWPAAMLQVPVATPETAPVATTHEGVKLVVLVAPALKVVIRTVNVELVPALDFGAAQ
jgi:hypothetical protein